MTNIVVDQFEEYIRLARQVVYSYNHDYRRGYMEGLRRRYYGPDYGIGAEHRDWLRDAPDDELGEFRRGYRDGFSAAEPSPEGVEWPRVPARPATLDAAMPKA